MLTFLRDLLGPSHVIDGADTANIAPYVDDYTEIPGCVPLCVAKVRRTEDIQAIVREAGRRKTPLCARVAGTNVGGLTIAPPGGVVLDMSEMNRVLELNEPDLFAVIEPGVTQQGLKDAINQSGLPLTLGYSLAPPHTSVLANALLGGLTNRSLKYGDQASSVNGLEVVLHDGSLLRTGAWAGVPIPFSRLPLPDVSGLFFGWQGTTGIVTKMAFQLWPKHPLNKRLFIMTYGPSATYKAMQRLCRKEVCDDIGGLSWPSAKMMFGIKRPHPEPAPGEPEFMLYLDLTAELPEEMAVKERIVNMILKEVAAEGEPLEAPLDVATLVKINPALGAFAEFPTDLEFLTNHGGGGLSWIGTYGPLSRFIAAAEAGSALMVRHGFAPLVVSRAMRGGHYGVLRFITTFDKKDEAEVARVRALNQELLTLVTEHGFLMYKTPIWAWRALRPHLDPNLLTLMGRIKQLMDPDGIFNPGKLDL